MIANLLNYLNVVLAICFVVGGFFAMRKGFFKDSAAIQEQTINALKVRVETLEKQAESDAKQLARLRQILSTVRHALKLRDLYIQIEDDFVTLIDANGKSGSTQVPNIARVRPVKLTPIDDDDTA